MNQLVTMLPILSIGTAILMAGILISREPKQSFQHSVTESLMWGSGLFLSFSAEILLFSNT